MAVQLVTLSKMKNIKTFEEWQPIDWIKAKFNEDEKVGQNILNNIDKVTDIKFEDTSRFQTIQTFDFILNDTIYELTKRKEKNSTKFTYYFLTNNRNLEISDEMAEKIFQKLKEKNQS